jgi:hypothetical protein
MRVSLRIPREAASFFNKSPLTPLYQRGELILSPFVKGGLRGIL